MLPAKWAPTKDKERLAILIIGGISVLLIILSPFSFAWRVFLTFFSLFITATVFTVSLTFRSPLPALLLNYVFYSRRAKRYVKGFQGVNNTFYADIAENPERENQERFRIHKKRVLIKSTAVAVALFLIDVAIFMSNGFKDDIISYLASIGNNSVFAAAYTIQENVDLRNGRYYTFELSPDDQKSEILISGDDNSLWIYPLSDNTTYTVGLSQYQFIEETSPRMNIQWDSDGGAGSASTTWIFPVSNGNIHFRALCTEDQMIDVGYHVVSEKHTVENYGGAQLVCHSTPINKDLMSIIPGTVFPPGWFVLRGDITQAVVVLSDYYVSSD